MPWDDLAVDNEREVDRFTQAVSDSGGFRIYVLLGDPPSSHQKIVETLQARLPGLVAHRMRETDIVPIDLLVKVCQTEQPAALILYGFEWWTSSSTYPFFSNLNMQRASLRDLLGIPLAVLLSSGLLRSFRRDAPDFLSMATTTFRFSIPIGDLVRYPIEHGLRLAHLNVAAIEDLREQKLELSERLHQIEALGTADRRDLMLTCSTLGDVNIKLGEVEDAIDNYQLALGTSREQRALVGDTPQSLRDEAYCLLRVGDALALQGIPATAREYYQEALQLSRQVWLAEGDTQSALRGMYVSLDRVARVLQAQGELDEALQYFSESLEYVRRTLKRSDARESLFDESISLDKIGDIFFARRSDDQALENYREALSIRQDVIDRVGETPRTLRFIFVSHDRIGGVLEQQGRLDEAADNYMQSLEIAKRIRMLVGDTPEALSDLAYILAELSRVLFRQGLPEATERADEALSVATLGTNRFPQIGRLRDVQSRILRLLALLQPDRVGSPPE